MNLIFVRYADYLKCWRKKLGLAVEGKIRVAFGRLILVLV